MNDLRIEATKHHLMYDILSITATDVLSEVESWAEMELYEKNKQQ